MAGSDVLPCGCAACQAAYAPPTEPADPTLPGEKPVWSLEQIVDGLLRWDARWGPGPVPYAFYTAAPPHLSGNSDYAGMVPFTAAEQEAVRRVLAAIADVAALTFTETADNQAKVGPGNARLTYAASTSTAQYFTAYASVHIADSYNLGDARRIDGAEMMFNAKRWSGEAALGGRQYYVLIHETLHGLGLPHPGEYNRNANEEIVYQKHAQFFQDSLQYTTMSYFGAENTGAQHNGVYPSTPMLHDIAALQALYGANTTTRLGDTVYGFNSNAGAAYELSGRPQGAVFSIWDAGGNDTLDLSGYASASAIDLVAGGFSSGGGLVWNISIAHGATIENAVTGAGDDRLAGNAADNVLRGGAGNDELTGGGGSDFLEGGAGDDRQFGQDGNDLMGGQDGADYLSGGAGGDRLYGDGGNDFLEGGLEADQLFGQAGDDLIGGQDGADYLGGGSGRDGLYGDAGNDFIEGGADDDGLFGQDGDDLIGGQDGGDYLSGGGGRDSLYGDAGNDFLEGGVEDDALFGQNGDDLIGGQDGGDYLSGGAGRDSLYGDGGNDFLEGGADGDAQFGQEGDDVLGGQDGDDLLDGGSGRDALYGDAGNDLLAGGLGDDFVDGGAGFDIVVFSGPRSAYNVSTENGVITVSGADGIDTLLGVEELRFDDGPSAAGLPALPQELALAAPAWVL